MNSFLPLYRKIGRPSCRRTAHVVALFGSVLVLGLSSVAQAASVCSYAFQDETRPAILDFIKVRTNPLQFVHPESLKSLDIISHQLKLMEKYPQLSKVKQDEITAIQSLIRSFRNNSENSQELVFEIAARYSILLSHGYRGNLKNELVWYQDILNRFDDFGPNTLETHKQLEKLMDESSFAEFRDQYLKGLQALYRESQREGEEKATLVFSFDDLKISDFILNADTGYFFVGLSRTNGLSFDLNHDFSAITFFMHDLAHVDLTLNLFRKLREEKFAPVDKSTIEKRQTSLLNLQKKFQLLDARFNNFEQKFIRIALFVHLHETGISPYQALYDFKHRPEEAAKTAFAQIKGSTTFQKPIQNEFNRLVKDPKAIQKLGEILSRFVE